MNYDYKKILVVSNNPFSDVRNNGKTLASFFSEVPTQFMAQLYFREETPHCINCNNYFRLTETSLLNIKERKSIIESGTNTSFQKPGDFLRIGREILWKLGNWKKQEFLEWLDRYEPQIIFFTAGDSGFAYDICRFIACRYKAKLFVYFTDDYILPRFNLSPLWWIRRTYIFRQMKNTMKYCDYMITISDEMKHIYKKIFKKDSIKLVNIAENMHKNCEVKTSNRVIFTYAGTLSFHREKSLKMLICAINEFNKSEHTEKAFLQIYSTEILNKKQKLEFQKEGASEYKGALNKEELKDVLNKSDVLVHAESFKYSCIKATCLSISTKIPEYLSIGHCILAIGPPQIASMRYLSDCAECVCSKKHIKESLKKVVTDKKYRNDMGSKALKKFINNHDSEKVRHDLMNLLFS